MRLTGQPNDGELFSKVLFIRDYSTGIRGECFLDRQYAVVEKLGVSSIQELRYAESRNQMDPAIYQFGVKVSVEGWLDRNTAEFLMQQACELWN